MIEVYLRSQKSIEETFDFIASADAMEMFEGWFIIPGIQEVGRQQDGSLIISNRRGGDHREDIKVAFRPDIIVFSIYPNKAFRLVVKNIVETWSFKEQDKEVSVLRSFEINTNPLFRPAVFVISFFFKKAIEKNNKKLERVLLSDNPIIIKKPLLGSLND